MDSEMSESGNNTLWSGSDEGDRLGRIEKRLERIDQYVETMQQNLRSFQRDLNEKLPGVTRNLLRDELQVLSYPSLTGAIGAQGHAQLDQLTYANQELEKIKNSQQNEIADLTGQLNAKVTEVRKLHKMIQQSHEEKVEMSNDEIIKRFSELSHMITQTVLKYFIVDKKQFKPVKNWSIMSGDDRRLYLRAVIADMLFATFFSKDARLFMLNRDREEALSELESKLISKVVSGKVSMVDIEEWRAKTVQICRASSIGVKDRYYRQDRLKQDIIDNFAPLLPTPSQDHQVSRDIRRIGDFAGEIAIDLRQIAGTFEWGQGRVPSSMTPSDFDLIGPYNMAGCTGPPRPVRILFGPLWRVVSGEWILLRKGEVLNGGGDEYINR